MTAFIRTPDGVAFSLGGRMYTVSSRQPHYLQVIQALREQAADEVIREILDKDLLRVTAAVEALRNHKITDDVAISGGAVMYRGKTIHSTLTARILRHLDEGFDLVPLARFLENLMQNPSYRAVQDLYTFLEYGRMPLTQDGCFHAYKAVRADYKDIRTGTFDNSIGCTVEMPRNEVDEDPHEHCSHGLHVCSFEYLPSYVHANGHVMLCKVNPRDVVAIPTDYHNTKMRVCRYEVIGEHLEYYSKAREDVLADTCVATEEEPFLVTVFGTAPKTTRHGKLVEAAQAAEDAAKLPSTEKVCVQNGLTQVELQSLDGTNFEGYPDDDDDDEDDDAETDELSYEVVRGESVEHIARGEYRPVATQIIDLALAKSVAQVARESFRDSTIQVREEGGDGSVELTLTPSLDS